MDYLEKLKEVCEYYKHCSDGCLMHGGIFQCAFKMSPEQFSISELKTEIDKAYDKMQIDKRKAKIAQNERISEETPKKGLELSVLALADIVSKLSHIILLSGNIKSSDLLTKYNEVTNDMTLLEQKLLK